MYDRTIQIRRHNRHKSDKTQADELQKVERNRAALDVKRGFELRYKKAFVNHYFTVV